MHDQHTPFAVALINAEAVLRCALPDSRGGQVMSDHDLAELCEPEEATYGEPGVYRFTVHFSSPNVVPAAGVEWHGLLRFDGGEVLDLGVFHTRCQASTADAVLRYKPMRAQFIVTERVSKAAMAPEPSSTEELLRAYVKDLLEDDKVNPRHGSLPVSLVQSLAMASPHYAEAAAEGFEVFLQRHSEDFTLFDYSRDDAGREGEGGAGELRVVLRSGKKVHFTSEEEEAELLAFLQTALAEEDLTVDELLLQVCDAGLGFRISPSFSQLMRFLARNKTHFSWSTDPSQVTMVSINDSAASADSAQPRQQQQQQQQQQRARRPAKQQKATKRGARHGGGSSWGAAAAGDGRRGPAGKKGNRDVHGAPNARAEASWSFGGPCIHPVPHSA